MNTEYLRYFIEICDCKSIQSAAKKLYVSAQGLGQGIQRLENLYGLKLLDRTQSGACPTEFGRLFYEQAKLIDSQIQQLDRLTEEYKLRKKTHICVATLGRSKLYNGVRICVDAYLQAEPNAMLDVCVESLSSCEELREKVRSGEVDIGNVYIWKELPGFRYYPTSDFSRLMLLTSKDGPLGQAQSVTWEQLKNLRFASAGEGDPFTELFNELCRKNGFEPNTAFYSTENSFVASLVDNNAASIILREDYYMSIMRFCRNARVVPLMPEIQVANALYVSAERTHSVEFEKFLDFMVHYFRDIMGIGHKYKD